MVADIFLSYRRDERERLKPLRRALHAAGYTVWWDQHLPPGEAWTRVIPEKIDAATCVIVAWSKLSIDSAGNYASVWVQREAMRGDEHKTLLPVQLDDVRTPFLHGNVQYVDMRSWDEGQDSASLQKLIGEVQRFCGARNPPLQVEVDSWIEADEAATSAAYTRFIETYGASRFASIARERLQVNARAGNQVGAEADRTSEPPRTVNGDAKRVFVSYPRDANPILVREIVGAILAKGYRIWIFDPREFEFSQHFNDEQLAQIGRQRGGENFRDQPLEAARTSDVVLFLISALTVKSEFQMEELKIALKRNRAVPVIISDEISFTNLPEEIRLLHNLNLSPARMQNGGRAEAIALVVEDLESVANRSPWGRQALNPSRNLLVGGAALLAGAMLGFTWLSARNDRAAWEMALASNNAESVVDYLRSHPKGRNLVEAQQLLKKLRQEEADWSVATRANTRKAFDDFLQKWPEGRFAVEAVQFRALARASCRLPEHGVESWSFDQTFQRSSGWRGGGGSPGKFCTELAGELAASFAGRNVKIEIIDRSERDRDTCFPGRCIQYNYSCTARVLADPIYVEKDSDKCP